MEVFASLVNRGYILYTRVGLRRYPQYHHNTIYLKNKRKHFCRFIIYFANGE